MGIAELILIAIGLAMDAFAVSIAKGLALPKVSLVHYTHVGMWFGGFQALMPIVGYMLATTFARYVVHIDHWIAFALLACIGLNMIREAVASGDSCENHGAKFTVANMSLLAIATSIDALAVGVSFAFLGVDIWLSAIVIGCITAFLSAVGLHVGNIFGCRFKSKAEILGGAVLIFIGVKILIEHLYF